LGKKCDEISRAIAAKERQMALLDSLKKSIIHKAVTKGLDPSTSLKPSGVQWIGDIPSGWKVDRIKDKTTLVMGGDWGDDPESESDGENVICLRVADLDDIYFSYENLTIRKIKNSSLKNRKVNEKTILLEKSGGGEKQLVGRAGLPMNLKETAVCSNFMAKIDFDESVDLNYVNYLFSSLYNQNLNYPFVQQTTGIQNLNVTYYLCLPVAFPPLTEQKAIAEYLDKETAKIETLKQNIKKQIEKLKEYKKSLIYECVTGKRRV